MSSSLGFRVDRTRLNALFRLGFPAAPGVLSLNLAAYASLVGPFYKKYAVTRRLPLLIGTEFQGLFHSPPGVLFTFPSRYSSTIGPIRCLALEGGPPCFDPDFTCPNLLWIPSAAGVRAFRVRGFHPLRQAFPGLSPTHGARRRKFRTSVRRFPQPRPSNAPMLGTWTVWAFPGSLVTTAGISYFDFFSPLTKIFQFGGCPS